LTPTITPTNTPTDTPTNTPTATSTLTAGEKVEALIDLVDAFVASGDIDPTMANSLKAKLEAALASLSRGNENSARGQLNAFINHVEAQRGKKISDSAADALIEGAEDVVDRLGPAAAEELLVATQAILAEPGPAEPDPAKQGRGHQGNPHGKPGH
jgi:hypothetical protein